MNYPNIYIKNKMGIYKIFENLIKEAQTSEQAERCVKMFGKELFSPQLGGDEPNTDYEANLYRMISNFTLTNYGSNVSENFIEATKNLQKCMSVYPEVLYPKGTAYRGTKLTLKKFLDINYKPNQWNKIEYVAHTPIQSWSEDFQVAEDFAMTQIDRNTLKTIKFMEENNDKDIEFFIKHHKDILLEKFKIPLILKNKATPDQFLFKAKYFNYLSQSGDGVGDIENEILRIDNRPMIVDAIIPSECEEEILATVQKIREII